MKRMILTIIGGLLVTGVLVWGQDGIAQMIPADSGKMMAMLDEDQGPLGRGMRMRHGGPGGPIGQIPSELAEKMALTDAQKDRMKSLNTAFAKDMARLEADAKIMGRAVQAYQDRAAWQQLITAGMRQDWSWTKSAFQYDRLYQTTVARRKQPLLT